MKKLFSVALIALMPSVVFAQEAQKEENRPILVLRVMDNSSPPKIVEGKKVSVSKNQDLCIILDNIPYKADNRITYYFTSPAPTKFEAPNMQVKTSADKKNFEIATNVKNAVPEMKSFHQCWRFENSDPKGIYKLDVKINDISFKGLSFEVVN